MGMSGAGLRPMGCMAGARLAERMAGVDLTLVERMVGVDLILASDRALVAVVDTEPDMKVDMKVNTALEAILLYLAGRAQAMGQRCWEDTVSKMG